MKICLQLLASVCCLITLTQCEFPLLADNNYRTLEEKTVHINGRRYVQERRVVCGNPLETQVISQEIW